MTPLDLTQSPPRSPKEEFGGMCFLPRMIDVARASLNDGNIGEYQLGQGMSGIIAKTFNFHCEDFIENVAVAQTDAEVLQPILDQVKPRLVSFLNKSLTNLTVEKVPEELRSVIISHYGTNLSPEDKIFDLLEKDDQRLGQ